MDHYFGEMTDEDLEDLLEDKLQEIEDLERMIDDARSYGDQAGGSHIDASRMAGAVHRMTQRLYKKHDELNVIERELAKRHQGPPTESLVLTVGDVRKMVAEAAATLFERPNSRKVAQLYNRVATMIKSGARS